MSTLTIGISVAGLSVGLMATMAAGIFLASALGFLAFMLFISAFAAGAVAFTALSGYLVLSATLAVTRHITSIVFGVAEPQAKAPLSAAHIGQTAVEGAVTSTASKQSTTQLTRTAIEADSPGGQADAASPSPSPVVLAPIKTPRKTTTAANPSKSPKSVAVRVAAVLSESPSSSPDSSSEDAPAQLATPGLAEKVHAAAAGLAHSADQRWSGEEAEVASNIVPLAGGENVRDKKSGGSGGRLR